MLVKSAPDAEYKEDEDKAEQLPQDYVGEGEQNLGYESDYASTYDYPAAGNNGTTLNIDPVCVFFGYPSFVWSWYL